MSINQRLRFWMMAITMMISSNHASSIYQRSDIDINRPEEWVNNNTFLIAAGTTCIGLLAIFGPLIAVCIYRKKKAKYVAEQEELNSVFKSSPPSNPVARKPRVSSMLMDDKRISAASSFNYAFPSNDYSGNYHDPDYPIQPPPVDDINSYHKNMQQPNNDETYSSVFRDSVINGSLIESTGLHENHIPPPFDQIRMDKIYMVVRPYDATEFDEMTVKEGDKIVVHKVYEDGWVLCMNQKNQNQGVIPSDCFDF